jgi:hypothetical protein
MTQDGAETHRGPDDVFPGLPRLRRVSPNASLLAFTQRLRRTTLAARGHCAVQRCLRRREVAHGAFDGGAHVELGVDGEPVKEQSAEQCHEGAGRGPRSAMPTASTIRWVQRVDSRRWRSSGSPSSGSVGDLQEVGVARAGTRGEGAGL